MKKNLPTRKNIRLKHYDYAQNGMYFITICVKNMQEILGEIRNGQMKLTKEGRIAKKYIQNIENVFKQIYVDEYVIMPNHIHAIILIENQNEVSISRIINQYKGVVTKSLGYCIWQKSYYDRIIREYNEYYNVKKYIQNNVINWKKNKNY